MKDAAIGYMIMAAEKNALPSLMVEKLVKTMESHMDTYDEDDAKEAYGRYQYEEEA